MARLVSTRSIAAGRWLRAVTGWLALGLGLAAQAAPPAAVPASRSIDEWLTRMHTASMRQNFVGTFVLSSQAGAMSSGRIWHAGDGQRLAEKVETLTGEPRAILRRDDDVLTLMPGQRLARLERRKSSGQFPGLLKSRENAVAEFYVAQEAGTDRVAGFEADVVTLVPRDKHRYGYRVWSEKRSGLVVKLQTLDADGYVLEQAAFSELQIGAPLRPDKLVRALAPPEGWRVERIESVKTTAADEGWEFKSPVPGFKPVSCYRRLGVAEGALQCVFSDGLASISLFVEAYDPQRHGVRGPMAAGASQTQTRRIQDWWLTAVGEVPPQTLRVFAQALERRK